MTSRVRLIATLLTGFGIVGFVFLNYQDPWPPLVPRQLEQDEPESPPLPRGAFPLDESAPPAPAARSEAPVRPEVAPTEVAAIPTPPAIASGANDLQQPLPPAPEPESVFETATRLLESADLQPLHAEGALLGVRIGSVEHGSFFARAGLRSGDVVRSVNDMRLDDPNAAAVLARQIERGIPLDVEVERRDGTSVQLSIPLRDLLATQATQRASEGPASRPGPPKRP
jgi:hypothetical protein